MNKFLKGAGFYLLIFIIIVGIVQFSGSRSEKVEEMKFSNVYRELMKENISSIKIVEDTVIEGTIKSTNKKFKTYIPEEVQSDAFANELLKQSGEGKLQLSGAPKPTTPWFFEILPLVVTMKDPFKPLFIWKNRSSTSGSLIIE